MKAIGKIVLLVVFTLFSSLSIILLTFYLIGIYAYGGYGNGIVFLSDWMGRFILVSALISFVSWKGALAVDKKIKNTKNSN